MRGRPPKRKLTPEQEKAAEAFIEGAKAQDIPGEEPTAVEESSAEAEERPEEKNTEMEPSKERGPLKSQPASDSSPEPRLPWKEAHVRDDVIKGYSLRLPEPLYLKLKYVSNQTGQSMNEICKQAVREVIEQELAEGE